MELDEQLKKKISRFLKKNNISPFAKDDDFILLAGGGSDRCYYRILAEDSSFVLMVSPAGKREITAFIDVGKFLFNTGIGVPEIIDVDEEGYMVLLEDLGDDSLYNVLSKAGSEKDVIEYYEKVLLFLAEMQIRPSFSFDRCNYLKHRTFGYESFRWETDYFIECFVRQFCEMAIPKESVLEDELNHLAFSLDKKPKYFMHRDFQSQNIHFKNGCVKAIDFQTATKGLLQYDLASLLKDAYFVIDEKTRDALVDFYMDVLTEKWDIKIDRQEFVKTFHLAGLQRNMQALGAFSFLGLQKGKKNFTQYIPAALSSLKEALLILPEYSVLKDTVLAAVKLTENKDIFHML